MLKDSLFKLFGLVSQVFIYGVQFSYHSGTNLGAQHVVATPKIKFSLVLKVSLMLAAQLAMFFGE